MINGVGMKLLHDCVEFFESKVTALIFAANNS